MIFQIVKNYQVKYDKFEENEQLFDLAKSIDDLHYNLVWIKFNNNQWYLCYVIPGRKYRKTASKDSDSLGTIGAYFIGYDDAKLIHDIYQPIEVTKHTLMEDYWIQTDFTI